MAEGDSFTYCDSDEEVFFGKVTEKEILKRALLGMNCNTPDGKFTPRAKALIKSTNLPDVLNGSRSETVVISTSAHEIESGYKQCACPSLNSSFNEDEVIYVDSANNSVQIISDDESFLLNEKLVSGNNSDFDIGKENVGLNEGVQNLTVSSSEENKKFISTSAIQETNIETIAIIKDPNCYLTSPTHPNDEEISKSKENAKEEAVEDMNETATDIIQNQPISGEVIENTINNENIHNGNISLTESSKEKNPLQMSENDIVYSVNERSSEYFVDIKKDSEFNEVTVPIPHEFIIDSVPKKEVSELQSLQEICLDKKDLPPALNDTDYISINGISDTVLNISQESSIMSPAVPESNKIASSKLLANVIYEDVSFDEEQPSDAVNQSNYTSPKSSTQTDDLHMSVDEPYCQENLTLTDSVESGSSSHPSLLKSCFDGSSFGSYHTACTASENYVSKPSSDSFNKYRETLNDTVGLVELDAETGVDIDRGKNETSFEIIVQNRQNSFISSSPSSNVKTIDTTEKSKLKSVSKLPLFNHSSKSLIQPPKLNFTSGSLKSNSYKWAKHIQKLDLKTPKPNKEGTEVIKNSNSKICTPRTYLKTPNSNKEGTEVKQNLNSKICTPRTANRYRNIVSPVRAYISGSPTVLQERKDVREEIKLVVSGNKNTNSHLPIKIRTPLTGANVMKKLKYEETQGQENLNPNYSRDTLPPRTLQNSEAVFMKEPEPPKKYLPKMGQKLQKLLDTPRPKLVVHHGRVKNSPDTKGVLMPSTTGTLPEHNLNLPAERVSIRVVKNVENTNKLK